MSQDSDFTTVSGKAVYLQRMAMPPDTVFSVRVEDVSLADIQSLVLSELTEPFGDRQAS